MSQKLHTLESCNALAATCKSQSEFRRQHSRAYWAARAQGWLYQLYPNDQRKMWTREECAAQAAKYKTRSDIRVGAKTLYAAIMGNGWADLLPQIRHKGAARKHTKESCKEAAAGCQSRNQFKKKNHAAYAAAYSYGWLDEVCPAQPPEHRTQPHTKDSIRDIASQFRTRSEMARASGAQHALRTALKLGWEDVLPPKEMQESFVYILQTATRWVYKVGVSHEPQRRCRTLGKDLGENTQMLAAAWSKGAPQLEAVLLSLGQPANVTMKGKRSNGLSEFRVWTPAELQQALNLLVQQAPITQRAVHHI